MEQVFADTSYWIALLNPRDHLHEKAVAAAGRFSSFAIVTSEMVLVEFLNGFSDEGPRLRNAVASAVEILRSDRKLIVMPQTSEQFEDALKQYRKARDKSWSLTDCTSFNIMQDHGIRLALTHDRHFAQAGFDVLLR